MGNSAHAPRSRGDRRWRSRRPAVQPVDVPTVRKPGTTNTSGDRPIFGSTCPDLGRLALRGPTGSVGRAPSRHRGGITMSTELDGVTVDVDDVREKVVDVAVFGSGAAGLAAAVT